MPRFRPSSNSCGAAYFYDDGDTFKILDVCSDGKGVRLQYTNPAATPGGASPTPTSTTPT